MRRFYRMFTGDPKSQPPKRWLDADGNFRFGKYRGESASDIAADDPHYLLWILDTVDDINKSDRETIEVLSRRG